MKERRWRNTLLGEKYADHRRTPEATTRYIVNTYDVVMPRLKNPKLATPTAGACYSCHVFLSSSAPFAAITTHAFLLIAEAERYYTCRYQVLSEITELERERRRMTLEARNDTFLLSEYEYRCLRPERRCHEILALCQLFFLLPIPEPVARTRVSFCAFNVLTLLCSRAACFH